LRKVNIIEWRIYMMTRLLTAAAIATLCLAGTAQADGHTNGKGNAEARAMADALKGGGGGNNSPLKALLELEGNGGVASFVSGKGNGGWGNVGSTLTGQEGVSVSGR
jgi:hypothetical protein